MQERTQHVPTDAGTITNKRLWNRLVEAACATVAEEPTWLIEAILVVQHAAELTPEQRAGLMAEAERLALAYGVEATAEPDEDGLTVRFAKAGEGASDTTVRFAYVMPSERVGVVTPIRPSKV